jgi:hypothetical protein
MWYDLGFGRAYAGSGPVPSERGDVGVSVAAAAEHCCLIKDSRAACASTQGNVGLWVVLVIERERRLVFAFVLLLTVLVSLLNDLVREDIVDDGV